MLYLVHLTWAGFELTTLVVIGTDCIASYKSNHHTIQPWLPPVLIWIDPRVISGVYLNVLWQKIPRHISDHDAAIAFIKCPKATSRSFTRDIWLYDQTDFAKFNQMLTDINVNEKLCNFDDVDDMCEEFSKNFLQISSACIPSKTILIREKDKPWFSNEIRKEIHIGDRLRKKLKIKILMILLMTIRTNASYWINILVQYQNWTKKMLLFHSLTKKK